MTWVDLVETVNLHASTVRTVEGATGGRLVASAEQVGLVLYAMKPAQR